MKLCSTYQTALDPSQEGTIQQAKVVLSYCKSCKKGRQMWASWSCTKRSPIFLNILVALPWGCSSHKRQPTRKLDSTIWKRGKHPTCQLVVFAVFEPFRTCQLVSPAVRLLWQQKRSDAFVTSGNKAKFCCSKIHFQQFAKTTFHQSWVSWSCLCGRFSSIVSCAWLSWNATLSNLVTLGKVFQPGHIQTEAAAIASNLASPQSSSNPRKIHGNKKLHTSATLQVGGPNISIKVRWLCPSSLW